MFIFGRHHHNLAEMTPAKYEHDIKQTQWDIFAKENVLKG